jgi:hypothetical protein
LAEVNLINHFIKVSVHESPPIYAALSFLKLEFWWKGHKARREQVVFAVSYTRNQIIGSINWSGTRQAAIQSLLLLILNKG